jgi:parallel beta-helix repeat protein
MHQAQRARSRPFLPFLERMEDRVVLSTFIVTNTADSGPGSLRQAILDSNAANPAATGGTSDIVFDIPASTASNLGVAVPGFDPATQTWTISPLSPLPTITQPVTIDGYSQAQFPIPYRYPSQLSSTVQSLSLSAGSLATGGYFTITTNDPLLVPGGTTVNIPYNATAAVFQAALEQVVGRGNVSVIGDPASGLSFVTFQGNYAGKPINTLNVSSHLVGIGNPAFTVQTVTTGGLPVADPTLISSSPNTIAARAGNNAHARVIIDGSQTGGGTGFQLEAPQCVVRGLAIDGFGIGVSVPRFDASGNLNVGNVIQGNFIGRYLEYLVDPDTGLPQQAPNDVVLAGLGNGLQGVYLAGSNTTIGGSNPQENNVISGDGQQGVWIHTSGAVMNPGGTGNVVEGNQIGVIGPSTNNLYFEVPNGAEGVLVDGSSNEIGGPVPAAGNVISANQGAGARITGTQTGAIRNTVADNYIGIAPGGGYRFGSGNPGNSGDGVRIEDSGLNQVDGNTISSNLGAGVYITGASAAGNIVARNLIGLTSDGTAAKGNVREGVADYSPQTVIGPGNIISGNLRGVLISGPDATGVVVNDNLIGTDITGTLDLGNAQEGVRIENATGAVVEGNAKGSQVISGNLRGVVITGTTAARNLVAGNLIGTDKSGLKPLPNAQEGVQVDSASGNTIGGTTSAARNVISANHWGLRITGAAATSNVVQGNDIGSDITGQGPLGNEVDGVIIEAGASGNLIGGSGTAAGNVIAFNAGDAVRVDAGIFNSILTNSIFSDGGLGIDLVNGGNHNQPAPVLISVQSAVSGTTILGSVQGTPSTPYTVQFFANAVNRPEGRTFLGQVTVTTNGSGFAGFTANLPLALDPAKPFITATATSAAGDTSEFSTAGTVAPLTVEFAMASYTVSESAGTATITVVRSSGGAAGSVAYATSDATAHAGVDYVGASGVLSFAPGETALTFTVSIINTQQVGGSRFLNLSLSNATGGMTLGIPSTATLTIFGFTPGPTVLSLRPILMARGITSVVLVFSEPLDPTRAVNLLNYGYSLQAAGRDGRFGTADDLLFGIASASYNATNDSVTLQMANPIRCNSFIRLTINQSTDNASVPVGVADINGNLLDGNYDGLPGGVFTATFARGQHLSYPDGNGNSVGLKLSGGGTMVLTRRANGNAWQLSLQNTAAGRSTLSGQVRKASPGATGLTPISSIVGTAGVRNLLTNPPFVVGGQPAANDPAVPASRPGRPVHQKPVRLSARPVLIRRQPSFGPHPASR